VVVPAGAVLVPVGGVVVPVGGVFDSHAFAHALASPSTQKHCSKHVPHVPQAGAVVHPGAYWPGGVAAGDPPAPGAPTVGSVVSPEPEVGLQARRARTGTNPK